MSSRRRSKPPLFFQSFSGSLQLKGQETLTKKSSCWHQFKAQQVETTPLLGIYDQDEPKDDDGEAELVRVP